MTDHSTREDFAWSGVEQLSEVPEGVDDECPICKMPLVSDCPPTTSELVPLHKAPPMREHDSAFLNKTEVAPFIRIRRCGHIYHVACLRAWIGGLFNKTCPMCRCVLFEKSFNYSEPRLRGDTTMSARRQGAEIRRLRAENATLKQRKTAAEKQVQELKEAIENIRRGYAHFVSDCTMMCFVVLMVVVAVYAWWMS
jgi:hypothetical protein